jgi:outer membrane protein assembly factor BamB
MMRVLVTARRRRWPVWRPSFLRKSLPLCCFTIFLLLALAGCGLRHAHLNPGPSAPGDWQVLGSSTRNTGAADPRSIPNQVDTLLWRHKTSGVASTEPIVRGGLLYYPGLDGRLEIYDARLGKRLARVGFKGPVTGVVFDDSGFVVATDQNERRLIFMSYTPLARRYSLSIPTSVVSPRRLDDGSFVVAALNGRVVRYDSLGNVLWTVEAKGPITAAPVVLDSVIFIAAGHFVSARHVGDGGQIWAHQASGAILSAPALGDRAYFGSTDSLLYAVNITTGVMEWFFAARGQIVVSPVLGPGRVYVASNDYRLYALDAATGDTIWSYDTGGPLTTRPTLAGGTLYVGTQKGELLVLDAGTGALKRSFSLDGPATTTPVVAGGCVYIADAKRRLYCFGAHSN